MLASVIYVPSWLSNRMPPRSKERLRAADLGYSVSSGLKIDGVEAAVVLGKVAGVDETLGNHDFFALANHQRAK